MDRNSPREQELLDRIAAGETELIGELAAIHGERIKRMVQVRLDPRLRSRLLRCFSGAAIGCLETNPGVYPATTAGQFLPMAAVLGTTKIGRTLSAARLQHKISYPFMITGQRKEFPGTPCSGSMVNR